MSRWARVVLLALLLTTCTTRSLELGRLSIQRIEISPVPPPDPPLLSPLLPERVAMIIPQSMLDLEVEHAATALESIALQPYRDLEQPICLVLGRVFASVACVDSLSDETIEREGIDVTVTPEIATASSSGIPAVWSPTEFHVTVTCRFVETSSKRVLFEVAAEGSGTATVYELTRPEDLAISARRASSQAMENLYDELSREASRRPRRVE